MPPTLFATTKKPVLNKNIDIFFVKEEVITVLSPFFYFIHLLLFFYFSLVT